MPPPWFVDERCRDLKIVSSFEALAVNVRSPSVIVGSQVVPNSDAENLPNSGSPALSMNQTIQQDGGASISRDFAVDPGREWAVFIENAGEPK